MPHPLFTAFLQQHQLPAAYLAEAEQHFAPVLTHTRQQLTNKKPLVVGINGSQGSGKTTMAAWLEAALGIDGLAVVSISLDDFYLGHTARQRLAETEHPLLATRGVPGTHNVTLALETLSALKAGEPVAIPRFDKASDDIMPKDQWDRVDEPVDVVILEGWCLGAKAVPEAALAEPVNALEAAEDADGRWRTFVNNALRDDYPALFAMVDIWVMLRAPGFEAVFTWRWQQEQKLAKKLQNQDNSHSGLMSQRQVARFVQFFQRLTETMLESLPQHVDHCYQLDSKRRIIDEQHPDH